MKWSSHLQGAGYDLSNHHQQLITSKDRKPGIAYLLMEVKKKKSKTSSSKYHFTRNIGEN